MAKAKDGSECFTRQNKAGGKYVTCKGTQGDSKATKVSARPAGKGGKAKRTFRLFSTSIKYFTRFSESKGTKSTCSKETNNKTSSGRKN